MNHVVFDFPGIKKQTNLQVIFARSDRLADFVHDISSRNCDQLLPVSPNVISAAVLLLGLGLMRTELSERVK